jgi:hypothetical protein
MRWHAQYDLSPEDVNIMLHAQDEKCAICGRNISDGSFVIDHSHASGRVRGLLCSQDNIFIGLAREDTATLNAAVQYLKIHREAEPNAAG